jgi:hypothetical protein
MVAMTSSTILAATRLAASEPMREGIRAAAGDAIYELLAARRGIGPEQDLDPAEELRVAALADEMAARGLQAAAAAAMLDQLERDHLIAE